MPWPLNRVSPASALIAQQLRQLGDVGGDAPGLVAGQQLARRPSARLILAKRRDRDAALSAIKGGDCRLAASLLSPALLSRRQSL